MTTPSPGPMRQPQSRPQPLRAPIPVSRDVDFFNRYDAATRAAMEDRVSRRRRSPRAPVSQSLAQAATDNRRPCHRSRHWPASLTPCGRSCGHRIHRQPENSRPSGRHPTQKRSRCSKKLRNAATLGSPRRLRPGTSCSITGDPAPQHARDNSAPALSEAFPRVPARPLRFDRTNARTGSTLRATRVCALP